MLDKTEKIKIIEKAIWFFENHMNETFGNGISMSKIFEEVDTEISDPYYAHNETFGMCDILSLLIYGSFRENSPHKIQEALPEFIKPKDNVGCFWFNENDIESRIDYLKNMLETIKNS